MACSKLPRTVVGVGRSSMMGRRRIEGWAATPWIFSLYFERCDDTGS